MKNPGSPKKVIAIIGAGPAGMFVYKKLVDAGAVQYSVHIYEAGNSYGAGMPYSTEGAGAEHVTNISGNELPRLPMGVTAWIKQLPPAIPVSFGIDPQNFSGYKVVPRLLFGQYLQEQFTRLLEEGYATGIDTHLHTACRVTDIEDMPAKSKVKVITDNQQERVFDSVIICTGHHWPVTFEGKTPGFYDSPYPPRKIQQRFNHPIAIKGSSLTAIDAIRTLARQHGRFTTASGGGGVVYVPDPSAGAFSIVMYSLKGLLPGIRFHLDDPRLTHTPLLSEEAIRQHMQENNGFLSLDFIFEKDFKQLLKQKDPDYYNQIKDMSLEAFTQAIMSRREKMDPFLLFKKEYQEARDSIREKMPVHWKELLASLSFAMNYPAKHFSAEDMLRLTKTLMPLISIVIAFVPQSSCEELMALHQAGRLQLVAVDEDSGIEVDKKGNKTYHYKDENGHTHQQQYQTFIDCTGQPRLWIQDFPFASMKKQNTVIQAQLKFLDEEKARRLQQEGNTDIIFRKDNTAWLNVPGIAINDAFRAVGKEQAANPRVYLMSVPFIGGYNPDYSGLDFCDEAASRVVADLLAQLSTA